MARSMQTARKKKDPQQRLEARIRKLRNQLQRAEAELKKLKKDVYVTFTCDECKHTHRQKEGSSCIYCPLIGQLCDSCEHLVGVKGGCDCYDIAKK